MTVTRVLVDVLLLAESTALPGGAGTVKQLLDAVGDAVTGGIRTVIVRDKHRSTDERRDLVLGVRRHLDPVDGTVLVAHDDPDADLLGADGVHLSSGTVHARCLTPSVPSGRWIGWSAHDAAEVANAAANGADYVTVSPVYPTTSKPGYGPPLGVDGLAALVHTSPIPVVALGGITTPAHVAECHLAGAVGVAVMGAILRSPAPAATATALLDSVSPYEKSSVSDVDSQRVSGEEVG